jgi:hypothetical protein
MSKLDENAGDLRAPLVIGVTGHRDLRGEDVPRLKEAVGQVIKKLKKDWANTPLILLSALAEGADRLVAEVAIELELRLIVPLPMPRHLYEMDFSTTESKRDYEKLMARAEHQFELPLLKGVAEADIREQSPARDRQYEQAGAYIVRQSHLLIALWNGKYRNLVGGTSRVVKFQLEGVPEPYAPRASPIDTPESGPVYHIVTPRTSDRDTEGAPFTLKRLFPKGYDGEAKRFARIRRNLDAFNREVNDSARCPARKVQQSAQYLFPAAETTELTPLAQSLRERFAIADTLAIYYQRLTQRTLSQLFILVLLVAISFEVYAHLFPEEHWLLAIYLLLTAGAYLWINRRAKRNDYQNKYQDYRALAEGMRVQFFWRVAGLRLSVADHYLRKQRSELDWICSGIRAWNLAGEIASAGSVGSVETKRDRNLELLLEHWVRAQSRFFGNAAKRDRHKLERYEPYVGVLLRIGIVVTVIVTLALLVPHHWQDEAKELVENHHNGIHGLLLTLISLPPIGAALLHGYIEKRALSEHFKQYSRVGIVFSTAQQRLGQMIKEKQFEGAENLIEELGKEALEENGDWVLLHRERPLEVPHAG